VVEEAVRLRDSWSEGREIDVFQRALDATASVIVRTLAPAASPGDREALKDALAVGAASFWQLLVPFSAALERLPTPATRRFARARRDIDRFLFTEIGQARSDPGRPGLLAAMLRASDEAGPMADRQARDEAVNLFLAARGTTATALTWAWYLLSRDPDAERALHEEVDSALGERLPTAPDLSRLPFTRNVLAEAMRMYPPAWALKREAVTEVPVGEYVVPAGSTVIVSPYVLHHDASSFPQPDRFDPRRFSTDGTPPRESAYLTFGHGPRWCNGEHFAWMEGALVLAVVAQRWRLRLVPGQRLEVSPRVTLKPKYGMRMVPEHRERRRPGAAGPAAR
jgi:cytochrome P450